MTQFLFVKQFRIPVYLNDNNIKYTYELCAGLVDKDKSIEEIAIEEIAEESGYKVDAEDLTKITSFFTNVGISGAKQHLDFATICENQKISSGGGINDEQIELYFLDFENIDDFVFLNSSPKSLTAGMYITVPSFPTATFFAPKNSSAASITSPDWGSLVNPCDSPLRESLVYRLTTVRVLSGNLYCSGSCENSSSES